MHTHIPQNSMAANIYEYVRRREYANSGNRCWTLERTKAANEFLYM